MATVYEGSGPNVSIGRVFSRAFSVIASNPVPILGVAFLIQALPGALLSYWRMALIASARADGNGALGLGLITIATSLIGLMLAMIVQGAVVRVTTAYEEGRRAGFGESASVGLRAALPLVGLALLLGLAVTLGLILLLVPGIILYIMWAVATPVLVEEQTGVIEAFGRSRHLTKGARWKVFGVELVVVVILWLIGLLFGLLLVRTGGMGQFQAMSGGRIPVAFLLGNVIVSTLIGALWSAIQTSLYVELRLWKDGPSARGLETIFS